MGHHVIPASDGEALLMLRKELPDLKVLQLPGYGIHYSSRYMPFNMLRYGPGMLKAMRMEHELTQAIVKREQIDCIISDNRYGCYHADIPSALITHQLQIFTGQKLLDVYVRRQIRSWCKKFDEVWVPDQAPPNSITGELSDIDIQPVPKHYLGVVSELNCQPASGKYDAIAVISGPEPQRTNFEQIVIKQLSAMPGKYAVVCGKPGEEETPYKEDNLIIIPFLSRNKLSTLLSQTNTVIARSGYTTVMDLARTGHKAILCPTPGHYEQVYLADRLAGLKQCIYKRQENLNLSKAFAELDTVSRIPHDGSVIEQNLIERLENLMQLKNMHQEVEANHND